MKLSTAMILGLALFCTAEVARADAISTTDILTNWTDANSPVTNDENNNWSNWSGYAYNGGNNTGSKISDFTTSGDFTFKTTIKPYGDNDLIGIVFGWQDHDNTYALTWGGGGVSGWNGIKLSEWDSNVRTTLSSQGGSWSSGTHYVFTASRTGNDISVSVAYAGGATIYSDTITDTTFMGGDLGFTTWSQATKYKSTYVTTGGGVPEPAGIALFALGSLAVVIRRKRRKA